MGLVLSIAAGFLPMFLFAWFLYYLDRYEKEPLPLLFGVFSWGAVVAAGLAFIINSVSSIGIYLLTQSEYATQLTVSTLVAPVVEETLKGMAVLMVFLVFRSEFDSPLDGLIYGGITALGFAATENAWYIHQLGYLTSGWQGLFDMTVVRVLIVGWQHPFYTAFIGLGFAFSRRSKEPIWRWVSPLIGWAIAVTFHLLHNLFAVLINSTAGRIFTTIWDWSGYAGLLILILVLIGREKRWMKEFLTAELENGIITLSQYQTACSAWRQSLVYIQARFLGNYKNIRHFYQICGDLMHKNRQLSRLGEEPGTILEVQHLRSKLSGLSNSIK
jgi:RsiW-degrading membrane proteinase PrsW (M82 family)